jgi:hypothetical protein
MKFLIPIIFCAAAFLLMAGALHFSRYKKRKSGCCGGGVCSTTETSTTHGAKNCEKDDSKDCTCENG